MPPPAGMDVIEPDMQAAYDLLMRTLYETACAAKPDVMIAIRRGTANLAAKRYCTQMWTMDSPQDYNMNRRDVIVLRTLGEGIMTHSCCTSWPISESGDNVARQMASVVLAGIPAVSVPLVESPPAHNEIMRAWLTLYDEHQQALAFGRLTPLLPTPPSAAIRVEGAREAYFGFFEAVPGLVTVTQPTDRVTLVNAFSDRLVTRVEGLSGAFHAGVYDRTWQRVGEFDAQVDAAGGIDLNVTGPSGCFSVVLSQR